MKLSEAILRGCELAPRQISGAYLDARGGACALGAAYLGLNMHPQHNRLPDWVDKVDDAFCEAFGASIATANDCGISREDIAGMLMAIGH